MEFKKAFESEIGLPKPDLIIYLELSSKDSNKRKGFGEEKYENIEFQDKVVQQYNKLKSSDWLIIEGNLKEEIIKSHIWINVYKIIENCSFNQIKTIN